MRDYSGIGKEVGEQMVALEDYLKGKTADEAINTPPNKEMKSILVYRMLRIWKAAAPSILVPSWIA